MPIGVSSIIQYKHFQRLIGQDVLNVQYYIITAMETIADDLSDYVQPMFNLWTNTLRPHQSTGLSHVRGELYEVNGLDFGVYAPATPVAGQETGAALPTFTAVKVQQVRETRATRHGWKRFAGLTEAQVSGNAIDPTWMDEWINVGQVLFNGLTTLDSAEFPTTRSITFQPIIWGGNDPAFPLGRYSAISSVVVSSQVTSQVSRKQGRGN